MAKRNVSEIETGAAQVEGGHPYRGIPATRGTPLFRVKVLYAIPAMDELKRRFPVYVNPAFNGITFKPIKVCEGVSRETREIKPEYVHLNRNASNDEVLAEIDKRGLRPCLPEELIAFGNAYPKEQRKFPIVFSAGDPWSCSACRAPPSHPPPAFAWTTARRLRLLALLAG